MMSSIRELIKGIEKENASKQTTAVLIKICFALYFTSF